jgi:sigma-B regulation protein RsbU (phosphoserine phosphatase)
VSTASVLPESFEEFLARSHAGFVYAGPDGRIVFANARVAGWLKRPPAEIMGTQLSDHLPIVRKVYYETHLAPLLKMQGHFDEVAMDLACSDGTQIPIFLSGAERHDESGIVRFICFSLFPAIDRRKYERSLVAARTLAASDSTRLREQMAAQTRERMKMDADLSSAQQATALREQFIAVLGHDLRNPLAAINGAMRLITKTPLNERAAGIVAMVSQSTDRMAELIDNVMDFARGRLGGGLGIARKMTDLAPVLAHVVRELEIGWPKRTIAAEFALPRSVYCDGKRIGQLLSNLLANALVHGAAEGPVQVSAALTDGQLVLAVANAGDPIPPDAMARLFQPFTREGDSPSQQGLGLGLYISAEIARAHDGELSVASSPEETRFILRIPADPPAKK